MILVTLSTQDKNFERLLKLVDFAIEKGYIKDKVIAQTGTTKYESKNMEILDFVPVNKFDKLVKDCDILITHGGVGSILTGLKNNKIVLAIPRLKKYKEHTNDHQIEVVNKLCEEGYILKFEDEKSLKVALDKAKTFKPKKYKFDNSKMINIIRNYIENN